MEKDCSDLGILFQETISDIKASFSLWEEFTNKAAKLNSAIKVTIAASISFHEAFYRLAEMANGTRGASKEIGSVLLKLCSRRQAVEVKLKAYAASLIELLVVPIQKSLDDWQKAVIQLDKDHSRDYKKAHSELKKASGETVRLQKKISKGKTDLHTQLHEACQDANAKFTALKEMEKWSVASALLEERSHLCLLTSCMKPILDHELAMLSEVHQLQDIADSLATLSESSSILSPAAEQVILDASQMQAGSTDTKKKSFKEDMHIEVVTGSLKSTGDPFSMQLTDLPTPSATALPPPLHNSPPSEAFVKRSKSIQSPGHSNLSRTLHRTDTGVTYDRQMPYDSCQSLQCSSGYGTMTNISTGSDETVGSLEVYETSTDSIPPFDKFSTLPNKRLFMSGHHSVTNKTSLAAVQHMFAVCDNAEELESTCDIPYDPYHSSKLHGSQPINQRLPLCVAKSHPPMPLQRQADISYSDDEFPLPPPPEDLLPVNEYCYGRQGSQENAYRKLPRTLPVVQNQYATSSAGRQETELIRASNWSDKSSGYSASGEGDDEEERSFARQLKNVTLKRAVSYDRSAPRLPKD